MIWGVWELRRLGEEPRARWGSVGGGGTLRWRRPATRCRARSTRCRSASAPGTRSVGFGRKRSPGAVPPPQTNFNHNHSKYHLTMALVV